MTEFHIIGLGNLCEFVIKNIDEKQTYGTFSACGKHNRKSMQEFVDYVNQLIKENEQLKERVKQLQIDNTVIKKRYDTFYKPSIWFTESHILTDKQANEIAEAINQSLKERRNKE